MLTLRDVAAEAEVSVATVSLVLNSRDAGRVSPEIAARVREVADRLGYAPNLVARGLRTKQTHTIGLLSDRVASTPFAGQMLAAAQAEAWHLGYLLLLIDTGGNAELENPAVTALVQRNVEGLIYASMYHRIVQLPAVPTKKPLVVLDGRPADEQRADWVVPDEVGGARAAVDLLIRAGHRRIAFCNNAEDIPASAGRLEGYLLGHRHAGLPVDESLIMAASESSARAAFPVGLSLLSRADRPSAVFCFSDRIAMGMYQAAETLGIRIPGDLSVVGFDNQEFVADAVRPGLTTVELPHRAMGAWAARRVIDRLRGDEVSAQGFEAPCIVVARDSVSAPSSAAPSERKH